MKIVWVHLCIALIIVSVDAQRTFNVSKPIVSLEKRPRPTSWLRPPEERRKLSIFPKKDMKFVVTPKTVVKSDDTEAISAGSLTKRPLMRKFIVHDKNERNSWYFAPREPLMKTKRFVVTMATPRKTEISDSYQKPKDEMAAESKKVNTFINNSKARQDLNKVQINKGNSINASRNKNVNVPLSKSFGRVNNLNDKEFKNKQANVTIVHENKVENLSFISGDHGHETSTNNAKTEENAIGINKTRDDDEYSKINLYESSKLLTPSNIEEIISATMESRSLDLSDAKLVDHKEDRAINFDEKGSNGNFDGSSNIKLLEILMGNIMNDTENFNDNVSFNSLLINSTIKSNQSTTEITEDIPQELYKETNKINNVTPLSNANISGTEVPEIVGNRDISISDKDKQKNLKQDKYAPNYLRILKTPVETAGVLFLSNQQESYTEHKYDNTENYTENNPSTIRFEIATRAVETDLTELSTQNILEKFENSITENIIFQTTFGNMNVDGVSVGYNPKFSIPKESLRSPVTNTDEVNDDVEIDELKPVTEVSNLLLNLSEETKENFSNESLYDKSSNSTSEEDSIQSYLTGEDTSSEVVGEKSNTDELSNELESDKNSSAEEVLNDSNMAGAVISNESVSDKSNSSTEEASNESMIDKSNNYTNEDSKESTVQISNESYLADGEISNESTSDKPTNLTEEISKEAKIDKSNNYTNETSKESAVEISNESNVAAEEISNESISEKSTNSTEEVSMESMVDQLNNYTDEVSKESAVEISNESDTAGGEISNISISDKSAYSTEDVPMESMIDQSNNYTDEVSKEWVVGISNESDTASEEISNESISDKSTNQTEEVSEESMIDQSNNYTYEVSNESNVEKTNNLTGEEITNESNMAGEEISNESIENSNNLTEEISNSDTLVDNSLTVEYLSEETGKDSADEFLRNLKPQPILSSEDIFTNRFKRSSNVIEEEMKATTISGFKYTGHEVRLGHNLNFKNINA